MGKNRIKRSANGGESQVTNTQNFKEQNEQIFKEICEEQGVGPKTKEKLKEILDFCNENNLELTKGATISTNQQNTERYTFGGTARASVIDHETGKRISIFDDVLKGRNSDDINKDSLNNLLKGLRYETQHTNPEFHNLYSEVLLTNHALIKDNGTWVRMNSLAFFDPFVPQTITVQTSMLGKKHLTKTGENSYSFRYDDVSARDLGDTLAHENGHAYDYHVIGNGLSTDTPSIFTNHGKNSNTIGPCKYATNTEGETISTVCEMVHSHKVRSDATLSSGTSIENAYHNKYGEWPKFDGDSKEERRLYKLWSNDPVWQPLVAEVERIML